MSGHRHKDGWKIWREKVPARKEPLTLDEEVSIDSPYDLIELMGFDAYEEMVIERIWHMP